MNDTQYSAPSTAYPGKAIFPKSGWHSGSTASQLCQPFPMMRYENGHSRTKTVECESPILSHLLLSKLCCRFDTRIKLQSFLIPTKYHFFWSVLLHVGHGTKDITNEKFDDVVYQGIRGNKICSNVHIYCYGKQQIFLLSVNVLCNTLTAGRQLALTLLAMTELGTHYEMWPCSDWSLNWQLLWLWLQLQLWLLPMAAYASNTCVHGMIQPQLLIQKRPFTVSKVTQRSIWSIRMN